MASPPASTTHVVFEKRVLCLIADMRLTGKTSELAEPPPHVNARMCHMATWGKKWSDPANVPKDTGPDI